MYQEIPFSAGKILNLRQIILPVYRIHERRGFHGAETTEYFISSTAAFYRSVVNSSGVVIVDFITYLFLIIRLVPHLHVLG